MERSRQLLAQRYLAPLKEQPTLYIGVELEFPIVNLSGGRTDVAVCQRLLQYLAQQADFEVVKWDTAQCPIEIKHLITGDCLLFEVAYTTLELAFGPVPDLHQVVRRFEQYLTVCQAYLANEGYAIQGQGIHPQWRQNGALPVQAPRYQMLMAYLALSAKQPAHQMHEFPEYGTFICGSQVQLDLPRAQLIEVLNAFNQIEAAKAYLFGHSVFEGTAWNTRIARDIFWEESMHGYFAENVGVFPCDFTSEAAYLAYLDQTALFTAEREGILYYFTPIRACDYLTHPPFMAWDLAGNRQLLEPLESDFAYHRAYHYQAVTTRGTIEFRSVCTQPLDQTFAPAAFHLGLWANFDRLRDYLATAPFFDIFGRDYRQLRRQFSKLKLTSQEQLVMTAFSQELWQIARQGLITRGLGEEVYLMERP